MAKRPDNGHDSTMELSVSQLVVPPVSKAPIIVTSRTPPKGNPQHDMSVWKQVVVGSDDFAPPVKPKAKLSRTKILVGLGVLGLAGLGGYLVTTMVTDSPTPPTVSAKPVAAPPTPAAPVADPPPRTVANSAPPAAAGEPAPPAPPTELATAAPAAGSAAPPAAPPLTAMDVVDAISGVAPIIKPAPKAKPRPKAVKKKTAAVAKKKPVAKKPVKKVAPKRR